MKLNRLLLIPLLLLVGCSAEADTKEKESIPIESAFSTLESDLQANYEEGLISDDFYVEAVNHLKLDLEFSKQEKELKDRLDSFEESDLAWEKELRDEYTVFLDEYLTLDFIYDTTNSSDEEYKLAMYVQEYSTRTTYKNLYMKEYLDTLHDNKLDMYYSEVSKANRALYDIETMLREYKNQ